jgi:NAD(P)-dependent dehydrogenase (short-subunit alcohol dehydrogenase family)
MQLLLGRVDTEMLSRFSVTADRKAGLAAGVLLKRMGRPEEIAQTIVFLASDQASFITGQIIGVDGDKMA